MNKIVSIATGTILFIGACNVLSLIKHSLLIGSFTRIRQNQCNITWATVMSASFNLFYTSMVIYHCKFTSVKSCQTQFYFNRSQTVVKPFQSFYNGNLIIQPSVSAPTALKIPWVVFLYWDQPFFCWLGSFLFIEIKVFVFFFMDCPWTQLKRLTVFFKP